MHTPIVNCKRNAPAPTCNVCIEGGVARRAQEQRLEHSCERLHRWRLAPEGVEEAQQSARQGHAGRLVCSRDDGDTENCVELRLPQVNACGSGSS
jgi:hypothetical protein